MRSLRTPDAAAWLHLAATPAFAAMALATAAISDDPAHMLCQAMGHGAWSLGGMPLMYLLMAMFHAAPWWKRMRRIVRVGRSERSRNAFCPSAPALRAHAKGERISNQGIAR